MRFINRRLFYLALIFFLAITNCIRNEEDYDEILNEDLTVLTEKLSGKKFSEGEETKSNICMADLGKLYPGVDNATKKRLQYYHGPCSPVLIVPGLLATRLRVKIDCPNLKKEVNADEFAIMCPDVCTSDTFDEVLWPSALGNSFSLMNGDKHFNTCFGYFFQFYNNKDSCPTMDDKEWTKDNMICRWSKYVKIYPHGADTSSTEKQFNGGFAAVNEIVSADSKLVPNSAVNAKGTDGFKNIMNKLTDIGYEVGFNLAANPYEFKEAYCTNSIFKDTFEKMLTMLYTQSYKKVVIVAHSYGNLNVHYQLTSNPKLKDMVANFISIAAPFGGAPKVDQLISNGTNEFAANKRILGYHINANWNRYSQAMSLPFVLSAHMLRPYNFMYELESINSSITDAGKKTKFTQFYNFMVQIQQYSTCNITGAKGCTVPTPPEDLKSELQFLNQPEICVNSIGYENSLKGFRDQINDPKNIDSDVDQTPPIYNPCDFNFYDYKKCAHIRTVDMTEDNTTLAKMCNLEDENNFFLTKCGDPSNKKLCAKDQLFKNYLKPFQFTEQHKEVCARNKKYDGKESDCTKDNFNRYTDDNLKISQSKIHSMCKLSLKKMENPGVPMTFILNKSFETRTAFNLGSKYDPARIYRRDVIYAGGDGTLTSSSALVAPLKWMFEFKAGYEGAQKVSIVDYCTTMPKKSGFMYAGQSNLNGGYSFLSCECINDDGTVKQQLYKATKGDDCAHASMLADDQVARVINDVALLNRNGNPITMDENALKYINQNKVTDTPKSIFNQAYFGASKKKKRSFKGKLKKQ